MNFRQMLDKFEELEKRIEELEGQVRGLKMVFGIQSPLPTTVPQKLTLGCRVCGLGSNGEPMGYACPRPDCPSAIRCVGDTNAC